MAVTLKDIANEVGVSVTTVSRGLAGYDDVAESTRLRVTETADRLGYKPNLLARRLQKQRTDTLGFILPTSTPRFSDPFFNEFLAGIGNEAASHSYDLLVSVHSPDSDDEQATYERAAAGGWVDGLIVVRTRVNDDRINLLCRRDFPFVAFGRTDDNCDFPFVDEDSAKGVASLVEHFINLGHRKIAFIAPPSRLMFGRSRIQAFQHTLRIHQLTEANSWIIESDMTQTGGADSVEQLLNGSEQPTAIIFGNDSMAIGAMSRMRKLGYTPGKDIAVGGFDNIPLAAHVTPSLTTIHQPIYDIGRRLCAMLVDIVNGRTPREQHVLLSPALRIRESSGSQLFGKGDEAYRESVIESSPSKP